MTITNTDPTDPIKKLLKKRDSLRAATNWYGCSQRCGFEGTIEEAEAHERDKGRLHRPAFAI